MSSAARTLELLSYFSASQPEIGLSQLCRLAGRDKATTHRHLQVLEEAGFVEQNALTKGYRLGPALLQLAQTRELTVPRKAGAQQALRQLCEVTGETSHVTVLSGTVVYALTACESTEHSIRVIMDTQTTPLHATASGLCALAFGPDELMAVATANMQAYTAQTMTTANALEQAVAQARLCGIARAVCSFEADVASLAAPLFDQSGLFAGAVSVASVATRFTPDLEARIRENLILASRDITHNWGGTIPDAIAASWETALSFTPEMEATS